MSDWIERAKRLSVQSLPTMHQRRGSMQFQDDSAEKAAMLERQTEFCREIARGVVSSTLMVLRQVVHDLPGQPVIEHSHRRLIKVRIDIHGESVVVNILSLLNGQIRLTCLCGVDGYEYGENFEMTASNETISGWLGSCLVEFFEKVR